MSWESMGVNIIWYLLPFEQVCEADLEAAADMIVEKSEGQLIYIKYAFDELAKRPGLWSLQQLQQLPPGLHGVFTYVLDTVQVRASA